MKKSVKKNQLSGLRVLFIWPPLELPIHFVNYPLFGSLSILYNAAFCKNLGAEVEVKDALLEQLKPPICIGRRKISLGISPGKLVRSVRKIPDVVIVAGSMFAHPGRYAQTRLAAVFRSLAFRFPKAKKILADLYVGGIDYLPYDPCKILDQDSHVDAVCLGEGESSLPAAVSRLGQGKSLRGLPRVAYRVNKKARQGPLPGPRILDLDQLPPPDFDLIDIESYFQLQLAGAKADLIPEYCLGGRFLPLLTSRGCPFDCSFCASSAFHRGFRSHSVDYVLKLVKKLQQKYQVERFFFMDDCINADMKRFEKLTRRLLDANITWEAPNGFRADRLSYRIVQDFIHSGMKAPSISAESGDPQVLNGLIKKSLNPDSVIKTAKRFHAAGQPVRIHYVIGFPGESRQQINRTLKMAANLFGQYGAKPRVQFATPLPGTWLYKRARKLKAITLDLKNTDPSPLFTSRSVIQTREFGPRDLARFLHAFGRRIQATQDQKLLVAPSYKCNNRCTFCCTDNLPKEDVPWKQLLDSLGSARQSGVERLDIDGGEPTLYNQLPELIQHAVALGFIQLTLVTNARRAAYKNYARSLCLAGLKHAVVSLQGTNSNIHDAISQSPGSFKESIQGIQNLASLGVKLQGNLVLTPENIQETADTAQLLAQLGCYCVNLVYPLPLGLAARTEYAFPRLNIVRTQITKILARLGPDRISIHNLPPCLFPKMPSGAKFINHKEHMEMLLAPGLKINLGRLLKKLCLRIDECDQCTERIVCSGMWRHLYQARLGPMQSYPGLGCQKTQPRGWIE